MSGSRPPLARMLAAAILALALAAAALVPAGSCCPPMPWPAAATFLAAPCCGGCETTLERVPTLALASVRFEAFSTVALTAFPSEPGIRRPAFGDLDVLLSARSNSPPLPARSPLRL